MASQLLSAMKSTGLWVVSYFTNNPSNRKEAHSGSKVDVEAPASSSSSSTPSHPISSPSRQPNIQSESQTQTHLSNPIAKAFRELEMGKSFLTFILPTTTMILALHGKDSSPRVLHSMLCLLCASLVALLYGISLRDLFPGIANASEQLGIAFEKPNPPRARTERRLRSATTAHSLQEEGDDGALTTPIPTPTPTPRSLNLQSSIDDRRGEQSTRNQQTNQAALPPPPFSIGFFTGKFVFCFDYSNIHSQFRWWFGQMLSTCDQLQEKDDA
ncbi:hypothetical protein LOK49_LG10G00527 [Camellia lanceoleosa]|uniref:Uncharacterized protein n=1 Tax=Camellia lanceoleosa TaxID=1840588 RepID=A0ACC0GCH3_9ERIC|nr:hypothetical protein LOK49_LG10G00527 [Camellia lanceoleosa]